MDDFESSLHCYESMGIVTEALLESVLTCDDELCELRSKGSSLCLENTTVSIGPQLDALCEELGSLWVKIVHNDMFLALVTIEPFIAKLGICLWIASPS